MGIELFLKGPQIFFFLIYVLKWEYYLVWDEVVTSKSPIP